MKMKTNINIRLEDSVLEQIDILADKFRITRSQMVRNCIDVGLFNAKALDSIGLLTVVSCGKDLISGLIDAATTGKLKIRKGMVSFPTTQK